MAQSARDHALPNLKRTAPQLREMYAVDGSVMLPKISMRPSIVAGPPRSGSPMNGRKSTRPSRAIGRQSNAKTTASGRHSSHGGRKRTAALPFMLNSAVVAGGGADDDTHALGEVLLEAFSSRRTAMQAASNLAHTMSTRAAELIEQEDMDRVILVRGPDSLNMSTATSYQSRGRGASVTSSQQAFGASATTPPGRPGGGAARSRPISAAEMLSSGCSTPAAMPLEPGMVRGASEDETLESMIALRFEQIEHLRGLQRTMIELENRAEEELAVRQAQQNPRGMAANAAASMRSPPLPDGMEAPPMDPLSLMSQVRLQEVEEARANFEDELRGDSGSNDPLQLSSSTPPPTSFSSQALAQALEALGDAVAVLVAATDSVVVSSTFKTKEEYVNLAPHMDVLRRQMALAWRAWHTVSEVQMPRFEAGELALIDSGVQEVGGMREQALVRREALTALEQAQRLAEEARHALRLRRAAAHARCDMLEEVLFGIAPSDPPDLQSVEPPAVGSPSTATSTCGAPRRSSTFRSAASPLPYTVAGSEGGPSLAPSARGSVVATKLVDYLTRGPAPDTFADAYERHQTLKQPLSLEDEVELRVAANWGNPHVSKALGYTEAAAAPPSSDGSTGVGSRYPSVRNSTSKRKSTFMQSVASHGMHTGGSPTSSSPASPNTDAWLATTGTSVQSALARARVSLLASGVNPAALLRPSETGPALALPLLPDVEFQRRASSVGRRDHDDDDDDESEESPDPMRLITAPIAMARTAALLQGLQRTIPAGRGGPRRSQSDTLGSEVVESGGAEASASSGRSTPPPTAEEIRCVGTRQAIERLLRYLQ